MLQNKGMDSQTQSDLIQALAKNSYVDHVSQTEARMLNYVEKLTLHPQKITARDIDSLKEIGFEDRAIHDICAIAAYFAFVNRIADGLGVELEARFENSSR